LPKAVLKTCQAFREAKNLPRHQQESKVANLKDENRACYDKLLDLEMQLVEQFEVAKLYTSCLTGILGIR